MSAPLAVAAAIAAVIGLLFLALMALIAWGTFLDWRYQRRLKRSGRGY